MHGMDRGALHDTLHMHACMHVHRQRTWPAVLGQREMLLNFITCSRISSGQFIACIQPPLWPHSPKKPLDVECRESTCSGGHLLMRPPCDAGSPS